MDKINLYDFYNHEKMKKDSKEGIKIVNKTDFKKYKNDRLEASKIFSVGQILELKEKCFNGRIIKIDSGDILIAPVDKITNKLIKKYSIEWINPVIYLKNL